jgi:hypothetical protein
VLPANAPPAAQVAKRRPENERYASLPQVKEFYTEKQLQRHTRTGLLEAT